jgi:hypothetical protein
MKTKADTIARPLKPIAKLPLELQAMYILSKPVPPPKPPADWKR